MQLRLFVYWLVAIAAPHSCMTTTAPPPLRTTPATTPIPSIQCPFDCDSPGPPAELLNFLPPPPLPSFMLHVLQEQLASENEQELDDHGHNPNPPQDGRHTCVLCDWALGSNGSDVEVAPSLGENKDAGWVAILIVASIASAIVGATLMVLVLKCKRLKILPVGDSCPILPRMSSTSSCPRRGAACVGDLAHNRAPPDDKREKQLQQRPKGPRGAATNAPSTGGAAGAGGWSFWRRTNSQERPLRSSSSVGSEENSYCEEPYVVSEHSSALYAELNSLGCSRASGSPDGNMGDSNARHQVPCCDYRAYSMNTYSQVAEQVAPQNFQHGHHHHHHHHHHPPVSVCSGTTAGTYENAAYITTETLQGESDTPSSAYYSDSSNNHRPQDPAKSSQRHKRKRHVLASGAASTGPTVAPGPLLARFSDSGSGGSDASYAAPPTAGVQHDIDVDGNCEVEEEDEDEGEEEEEEEEDEDDYDADGGFLGDFRVSKRPLPPIPNVHTHGDRPLPPLPSQYV